MLKPPGHFCVGTIQVIARRIHHQIKNLEGYLFEGTVKCMLASFIRVKLAVASASESKRAISVIMGDTSAFPSELDFTYNFRLSITMTLLF